MNWKEAVVWLRIAILILVVFIIGVIVNISKDKHSKPPFDKPPTGYTILINAEGFYAYQKPSGWIMYKGLFNSRFESYNEVVLEAWSEYLLDERVKTRKEYSKTFKPIQNELPEKDR